TLVRGAVVVTLSADAAGIDQLIGGDRAGIALGIAAVRLGGDHRGPVLGLDLDFEDATEIVDEHLAPAEHRHQVAVGEVDHDFRAIAAGRAAAAAALSLALAFTLPLALALTLALALVAAVIAAAAL